jgi:hypothetical protein
VEFNIRDNISRITSIPTEYDVNFSDYGGLDAQKREEIKAEEEVEDSNRDEIAKPETHLKTTMPVNNPLLQNKGHRRNQQPNFAGTVNLVTSDFGTYYMEEPGDTGGEGELYRNDSRNRSAGKR